MLNSPWTTWWQTDLPCEFSQERTEENRKYLINILGKEWLEKRITRRGGEKHPLIQRWINNSAGSYLELNSLAEDLRLLDKKPHFDTILRDLKKASECMATWHLVHCAAFFERGEKGIVSKFYPQTSESVPDFALNVEGNEVPVEAKLLTQSDKEIQFNMWAENLNQQINDSVLVENLIYPQIFIVIKDYDSLPGVEEINNSLREGLSKFCGELIKGSFSKYNIFIEPTSAHENDFFVYKSIYIFCPRHYKENIRMEGRIKDASKQLKEINSSISGIVCLGIGVHQEPHYIRKRLVERFDRGQLMGVSSVILIRSGTYMEPPKRSIIDLISIVSNKSAKYSVPGNLKFQPLGMYGKLIEDNCIPNVIPAYRHMTVEGKVRHSNAGPFMPAIKELKKEMLE